MKILSKRDGSGRVVRVPPKSARQCDASRQWDSNANGETLNSTVKGPSRDLYPSTAIINSHLLISQARHSTFTEALKSDKQLIRKKQKNKTKKQKNKMNDLLSFAQRAASLQNLSLQQIISVHSRFQRSSSVRLPVCLSPWRYTHTVLISLFPDAICNVPVKRSSQECEQQGAQCIPTCHLD